MNFPIVRLFVLTLLILISGCAKGTIQDDSMNTRLGSSIEYSIQQCGGKPLAPEWEISGNTKSDSLMLIGTILAGDTVYKNGAVLIAPNGKIEAVGCLEENANTQRILNVGNAIVSPGLINPHDHITYNQNFPGGVNNANYALCNDPQEAATNEICDGYRYNRRNEWRLGVDGSKVKINAPGEQDGKAVTWNELRHVLSGTTTIAGSGGYKGLVRNVDKKGLLDGLKTKSNKIVKCDTFPLGDNKDTVGHYKDCFYETVPTKSVLTDNLIYLPHVAEGIDQYAQNELYCLTGTGENAVDLKASNSSFIHTIAAAYSQLEEMSKADMTVVWSPRSNISLYGNTAMVNLYDSSGIRIALSSDWSPSGSSNMLREMVCAKSYSDNYLNGYFSSFDIWKMATINAARSLGVDDQIGTIKVGHFADIAIFNPNIIPNNPYDIFSTDLFMNDVALVLKGGKGLTGYKRLIDQLNTVGNCAPYRRESTEERAICLGETDYNLSELQAFNDKFYPLYFASVPPDEPTCTPARYGEYSGLITADDSDGDGIPNSQDNCPDIFNPIRPMDFGVQPKVCEYLSVR